MPYFEWLPDISVKHPEIDEQHQQLFALAEVVAGPQNGSADHRPSVESLQALIDYTRQHFAFEESLMRAGGYPEMALHMKFHASLLVELDAHCARIRRGSVIDQAGLIAFLWNWLTLHIDASDRQLVAWLATTR